MSIKHGKLWAAGIVLFGVILSGILMARSLSFSFTAKTPEVPTATSEPSVTVNSQTKLQQSDFQDMLDKSRTYVLSPSASEEKRVAVINRARAKVNAAKGKTASRSAVVSKAESIIKSAKGFIGTPYRWGGTTPAGFDCSGFVRYVFTKNGIALPRTSFEQFKVGKPVKRNELRPGDLVFFQTISRGPSDVRIYIGGGKTIGSANSGVGIENLSSDYWSSRYYGARRILN